MPLTTTTHGSGVESEKVSPRSQRYNIRFMPRMCAYSEAPDYLGCELKAFYCLELISRQGPRCQTAVCRDHVHKAWAFGQQVLTTRFPDRVLTLLAVRLMPLLKKKTKRARRNAAGAP